MSRSFITVASAVITSAQRSKKGWLKKVKEGLPWEPTTISFAVSYPCALATRSSIGFPFTLSGYFFFNASEIISMYFTATCGAGSRSRPSDGTADSGLFASSFFFRFLTLDRSIVERRINASPAQLSWEETGKPLSESSLAQRPDLFGR